MARPETAMEPSMEEILASIRKIIAEEPAGSARPKPADRAAPIAPGSSDRAAKHAPAPAREELNASDELKATTSLEQRDPFARTTPAPKPMPAPQREASPFGKSDPFAAPLASAPRESKTQSNAAAATPSQSQQPRMDNPAARSTLPDDSDVLFGRLAEALRGGLAAPTSSPKPAKSSISANLEDLDDLLAEPDASEPSGREPSPIENAARKPTNSDEARTSGASTPDFAAIFPRNEQTSTTDAAFNRGFGSSPSAAKPAQPKSEQLKPANPKPAHPKPAMGEGFERFSKFDTHTQSARAAVDDELADLLIEDDHADVEKPTGESEGASKPGTAPTTDVNVIDLDVESLTASSNTVESEDEPQATEIESDLQDLDGEEAVKSAFGALMAGLAASSSQPSEDVSTADHAMEMSESESAATPNAIEASEFDEPAGKRPRDSAPFVSGNAPQPSAAPHTIAVEKKPAVVAASLALPGIGTQATTTPEQTDFAAASSNREPGAVAPPSNIASASPISSASLGDEGSTATVQPPSGLTQKMAAATGFAATLAAPSGAVVGVRTVEDIVAELLRPMLREWLAENMPRMVEKALRIELAEGLKTVNQTPPAKPKSE